MSKIASWNKKKQNLQNLKDSQVQVMGKASLPDYYLFDNELDLKHIKFSKNVAVRQ